MKALEIRAANEDDADAIAGVQREGWRVAYRGMIQDRFLQATLQDDLEGRWQERLREPADPAWRHWVAERGGEVVGFAATGPGRDPDTDPARTGEVYALYVAPSAWRAGAGRALMAHALEDLAARGFEEAILWVLEDNRPARCFYEAMGWRADGARRGYFQDTAAVVRYRRGS